MYKLIDGALVKAPKYIELEGMIISNPTDEELCAAGYKPLIEEPYPEPDEKHYATKVYKETDEAIVQTWEIHEYPEVIEVVEEAEGE